MANPKLKQDKYRKARGGYARLLKIYCEECGSFLLMYQKDGPGILKRMYLDRIREPKNLSGFENLPLRSIKKLTCKKCKELVGVPYVYKKENRPAFRLFAGAVTKEINKS